MAKKLSLVKGLVCFSGKKQSKDKEIIHFKKSAEKERINKLNLGA